MLSKMPRRAPCRWFEQLRQTWPTAACDGREAAWQRHRLGWPGSPHPKQKSSRWYRVPVEVAVGLLTRLESKYLLLCPTEGSKADKTLQSQFLHLPRPTLTPHG